MAEDCVLCHRILDRRAARLHGGHVCHSCCQATFVPVACTGCGVDTPSHLGEMPAYCRTCQKKALGQCIRCVRSVDNSSFETGLGKACSYCRRFFEPARPCPCCAKEARHFETNRNAGILTPVCTACARKDNKTCGHCGKHRSVAGQTEEGKPLCRKCLGRQPFQCTICKGPGPGQSRRECMACYRLRSTQEEALDLAQAVPLGWARKAFEAFCPDWIGSHTLSGYCRPRLRRYARFFVGLATQFESLEAITAEGLLAQLEPNELRRHRVPYTWLCTQRSQVQVPAALASVHTERLAQARLLARVHTPWKKTLLEKYLHYLGTHQAAWRKRGWAGEHERFVDRTVTLLLRAAWKFLDSLDEDIQSVQAIDVSSLEAFVVDLPGHQNALHSFLGYLNRDAVLFETLHIDTSRSVRNFAYHYLLSPEKSQQLTEHWLRAPDAGLRNALMGLMMLVYARTGNQACSLKRGAFTLGSKGQISVRFGVVAIDLDPEITDMLKRYIQIREREKGAPLEPEDYLFTGNTPGGHFGCAGLQYVVGLQGVTVRHLYTTALANFFRAQLHSPKVLVRTLGITTQTAVKYWEAFSPRINDELRFMTIKAP